MIAAVYTEIERIRVFIEEFVNTHKMLDLICSTKNQNVFFDFMDEHKLELLIIDVTFMGSGGLFFIDRVLSLGLRVPVIILNFSDEAYDFSTFLKRGKFNQRYYIQGTYGNPEESLGMITECIANIRYGLSPREQEILTLVSIGMQSQGMADQLEIQVRTVETHRKNICRKTGISNVAQLTRLALQLGLTKLEDITFT